jgi:hypothetical protein
MLKALNTIKIKFGAWFFNTFIKISLLLSLLVIGFLKNLLKLNRT